MEKIKKVTGRVLLNFLNKLTKDQLKKEVVFISNDFSISLPITKFKIQSFDLLWDGEDDPSQIKSKSAFIQDGIYDKEEIENFIVEIEKGSIVLQ